MTRHGEIIQNNKFSIFLQCHKKEVSDEGDLLHACKDENYPQIDTVIFHGDGQVSPKFPKKQICNAFPIS